LLFLGVVPPRASSRRPARGPQSRQSS